MTTANPSVDGNLEEKLGLFKDLFMCPVIITAVFRDGKSIAFFDFFYISTGALSEDVDAEEFAKDMCELKRIEWKIRIENNKSKRLNVLDIKGVITLFPIGHLQSIFVHRLSQAPIPRELDIQHTCVRLRSMPPRIHS